MNHTTFEVRWPGPVDMPTSVEIFRRWGDDLLDRWDGRVLLRTTRVAGESIPYACRVIGTVERPAVRVMVRHPAHVAAVEQAVRGMFVTAPEALAALAAVDPVIAALEKRYPGVRPVVQADLFTALVRAISAQQVNLKWAAVTRRRLVEACGRRHVLGQYQVYSLEAERLAAAGVAALRGLQFTTRKAEYIIELATAVVEGRLDLEACRHQADTEIIASLTSVRGIGRWTAEWFLARALGRPCLVAGDLGVRKAVGAAYLQGRLPSEAEVRSCTAHWGAATGVAQQLLLHALSDGMAQRTGKTDAPDVYH